MGVMTFCDDFAQRLYTQVMRVRIKLLIFYWLDKERESKKKKIKKNVPILSNILAKKRKN
jgi:hypothetical protein